MLTRNSAIGTLSEVLVAVVTRTIRHIPTQVEIDQSDGMREPCAVNLDDLLMMPLRQLTDRQCELSSGSRLGHRRVQWEVAVAQVRGCLDREANARSRGRLRR